LLNAFRPIVRENASTVPYNGGNYSYLINFSSKFLAIIAAAVAMLDAVTTVRSLFTILISGCRFSRQCSRLSRWGNHFTLRSCSIDHHHNHPLLSNLSIWRP